MKNKKNACDYVRSNVAQYAIANYIFINIFFIDI